MSSSLSSPLGTALLALATFLLACWLTAWVRRYAIRARLLDVPNERSSHTSPTPRGGGVAIVLSTLISLGVLAASGAVGVRLAAALAAGGALVALLGFIDDKRGLSARTRFAGHMLAAAGAVWSVSPAQELPLFGWMVPLGFAAGPLAVLFVVWSTNLFNFMDGIDGIAGVEAISVAVGGALVWALVPGTTDWQIAVVIAASVGGFLVFNFPPASIFMGDAGSGFLGFVIGVLTLWAFSQTPHLVWSWLILSACFLVDATTTLVRRVLRGERFHVAHRNHAYQYAARKHGSHKRVTLVVLLINTAWLLPWAIAVGLKLVDGAAGMLIATCPLLVLVYWYKGGDREGQNAG